MPNETGHPTLDAQKEHWEGMLGTRAEIFGSGAEDHVAAATIEARRPGRG